MPHKKESVKNRRIGESGYVLPEHIPPGEIVCGLKSNEDDFMNQSWRIGKTLGIVFECNGSRFPIRGFLTLTFLSFYYDFIAL